MPAVLRLRGGADPDSDSELDSMPRLESATPSSSDAESISGADPHYDPDYDPRSGDKCGSFWQSLPVDPTRSGRDGHSHAPVDAMFTTIPRGTNVAALARSVALWSIDRGLFDFEWQLDALWCIQRCWRVALFRRATRRLLAQAHASHARWQLMLIALAIRSAGL